MELSDLLDSDTLEYCKHTTDANTSEGDQSLDELLLAACEPWQQHPPTNTGTWLRNQQPRAQDRTL